MTTRTISFSFSTVAQASAAWILLKDFFSIDPVARRKSFWKIHKELRCRSKALHVLKDPASQFPLLVQASSGRQLLRRLLWKLPEGPGSAQLPCDCLVATDHSYRQQKEERQTTQRKDYFRLDSPQASMLWISCTKSCGKARISHLPHSMCKPSKWDKETKSSAGYDLD